MYIHPLKMDMGLKNAGKQGKSAKAAGKPAG